MAARIRLKRLGRKNLSFFRLGVFHSRTRRNGRAIEELGHYDPHATKDDKKYSLNRERISFWLGHGAKASPTVQSILLSQGIDVPGSGKKRALSPAERSARERQREEKQKAREKALKRKEIMKSTVQTPMSKKEKREAKKAGG